MDKKEKFKEFAKSHKDLIDYVSNHEDITWQKLYEIYDIYGEDEDVWEKYLNNNTNISEILKNVDMNKVKEHITTAQKALTLIEGLITKDESDLTNLVKGPLVPRPIEKFFGD